MRPPISAGKARMTAETTGALPWPDQGFHGVRRSVRPVVGVLADGTPYYAPIGEIVSDGTTVTCHLCGRPRKSVAAHLRAHGWPKAAYCETFGLERSQPLEGSETRKRRAASFAPRLIFDPAIRAGSAAGRQRAAAGELSRDAARASTGRPLPEQRRRKASRGATAASSEMTVRANKERAARHRAEVAARVASEQGYPTLGAYVSARVAAGASLAAISREAGLNKDWLHRHLAEVDPVVAAAVRQAPPDPDGPRWLQTVTALGFADVAGYLRDRHRGRHVEPRGSSRAGPAWPGPDCARGQAERRPGARRAGGGRPWRGQRAGLRGRAPGRWLHLAGHRG